MKNLLQYAGKKHYFYCDTKRDFDDFIDTCIANGITEFKSGSPLSKDEYYNHDSIYCKVKKDKTLAFLNYESGHFDGTVERHTCSTCGSYPTPIVSQPKASRKSVISSETINSVKENKNMKFNNLFAGMGFEIAKTNEFGLDLMSGKLAYLGKGKAVIIDGKRDLTETLPDMVKQIPLMFMPTQVSALKEGDIIKRNNRVGVVLKVDGAQIQIQNYSGTISTETVAKHVLTQTSFIPKLFNPFDGFGSADGQQMNPVMAMLFMDNDGDDSLLSTFMLMQAMNGGAGNNPQMQSMLPFLLMKEDGGKDSLMKLMMFSGAFGGQAQANGIFGNPLMTMAMLGGKGGSGIDMETMLMASMFGSGASPFGGLFGGQTPVAPVVPTAPVDTTETK